MNFLYPLNFYFSYVRENLVGVLFVFVSFVSITGLAMSGEVSGMKDVGRGKREEGRKGFGVIDGRGGDRGTSI